MLDPNVETFAVKSVRRKGKRRVVITGDNGSGVVSRRIELIPNEWMHKIPAYLRELKGSLYVSFDAPNWFTPQHFVAALLERIGNDA